MLNSHIPPTVKVLASVVHRSKKIVFTMVHRLAVRFAGYSVSNRFIHFQNQNLKNYYPYKQTKLSNLHLRVRPFFTGFILWK